MITMLVCGGGRGLCQRRRHPRAAAYTRGIHGDRAAHWPSSPLRCASGCSGRVSRSRRSRGRTAASSTMRRRVDAIVGSAGGGGTRRPRGAPQQSARGHAHRLRATRRDGARRRRVIRAALRGASGLAAPAVEPRPHHLGPVLDQRAEPAKAERFPDHRVAGAPVEPLASSGSTRSSTPSTARIFGDRRCFAANNANTSNGATS